MIFIIVSMEKTCMVTCSFVEEQIIQLILGVEVDVDKDDADVDDDDDDDVDHDDDDDHGL